MGTLYHTSGSETTYISDFNGACFPCVCTCAVIIHIDTPGPQKIWQWTKGKVCLSNRWGLFCLDARSSAKCEREQGQQQPAPVLSNSVGLLNLHLINIWPYFLLWFSELTSASSLFPPAFMEMHSCYTCMYFHGLTPHIIFGIPFVNHVFFSVISYEPLPMFFFSSYNIFLHKDMPHFNPSKSALLVFGFFNAGSSIFFPIVLL